MMNKIYFFLLLTACSSTGKEISVFEKHYSAVSDSLVKYKKEIIVTTGTIDSSLSDYMNLDYSAYKSKYKLSDLEMEELAQTFIVTYEIGQTRRAIEENMSIKIDTSRSDPSSDYKFDPKEIKKNEEGSTELMDAYDSDKQPEQKLN